MAPQIKNGKFLFLTYIPPSENVRKTKDLNKKGLTKFMFAINHFKDYNYIIYYFYIGGKCACLRFLVSFRLTLVFSEFQG
jgi:hypothetical protein